MPSSIVEAERMVKELMDAIQAIEGQLGNRDRRDESGRRLNDIEYHQWRQRAVWAKTAKLRQYRQVKQWIRDQRQNLRLGNLVNQPTATLQTSALAALAAALRLLSNLRHSGRVVYTEDEQTTIYAIADCVDCLREHEPPHFSRRESVTTARCEEGARGPQVPRAPGRPPSDAA